MDKIQKAITELALDSENSEKNYAVAILYEGIGQTAAAITYFYRAAERTQNLELAYECLLKISLCLNRQSDRFTSVKVMIQHALCILPNRPEAYFLMSRLYEQNKKYSEGYTIASLGLKFCDFSCSPLRGDVEYVGQYGLIFEKAVCAWWWGKNMESRALLRYLTEQNFESISDYYLDIIYNNIKTIGIGPESITHKHYNQSMHSKLRYKFKNSEKMQNTYGQVFQDIFVLSMVDGKMGGTYLEVGSAGPFYGNNTAMLELDFMWKGVGIDFDESFVQEYRKHRKNSILHLNALEVDYSKVLSEIAVDNIVDYLQLDCEPSDITYEILLKIPLDTFKFRVITYEHDHYQDRTRSYRAKSREYLQSKGYILVANDISPEGSSSFEDWWAHPDLVDKNILEKMTSLTKETKNAETYIFPENAI